MYIYFYYHEQDIKQRTRGELLHTFGKQLKKLILYLFTDKPEIAMHPQNITTREGHNVTLYCNATGNPAPTISWYKNGYPISNGFRIIFLPNHEQLAIRNVNRIDRGDYTCRAKNRAGTNTSNASTINVQCK